MQNTIARTSLQLLNPGKSFEQNNRLASTWVGEQSKPGTG